MHERIRQRLTKLRMLNSELADLTETPRGTVENWLQGRSKIPAAWIAAVVPILRVSPLWLLREEGPEELADVEGDYRLDVIGRVVNEEIPPDVLRKLARTEDWADLIELDIEDADGPS